MEIEFIGAAQAVTGSMHLIKTRHARILLDCGMFQGRRRESIQRNRTLPVDSSKLDAVVLSHAHIDHSGCLPVLTKNGYQGAVYATPATRDLCAVMLEDAAMIQAADARYINKVIERDNVDMDRVDPLYDSSDVVALLSRMISVPYHRTQVIAPGVLLTFLDAGHVLGSAITILEIDDDGATKRVVFTGDLGRKQMPILRDPEVASGGTLLISESTYGDRLHSPIQAMEEELGALIHRTYERGGKVIIPSFALERAQEIVYALKHLDGAGRMPPMPVYVDSPLTVKITDIFRLHPECYDTEAWNLIRAKESPFDFRRLEYISDKEDSKAISSSPDPCVIISASGMCEAGRVLHHLQGTIEHSKNLITIVGFQAQHTLGRRIVERRRRVKIFGVERDLNAEVAVLNGFSAHADQKDLVEYAEAVRDRGRLEQVVLVHGEPKAQGVLSAMLSERKFHASAPAHGDRIVH